MTQRTGAEGACPSPTPAEDPGPSLVPKRKRSASRTIQRPARTVRQEAHINGLVDDADGVMPMEPMQKWRLEGRHAPNGRVDRLRLCRQHRRSAHSVRRRPSPDIRLRSRLRHSVTIAVGHPPSILRSCQRQLGKTWTSGWFCLFRLGGDQPHPNDVLRSFDTVQPLRATLSRPGSNEVFLTRLHRAIIGNGLLGQHLVEIDAPFVLAGEGGGEILKHTLAHTANGFASG